MILYAYSYMISDGGPRYTWCSFLSFNIAYGVVRLD